MRDATALESALGLFQLPSRARTLRARELPSDLEILLRIVSGDARAMSHAMETSDQSESTIHAASSFYLEQILLHPGADSYRVLGAGPDATADQLRRNMALLLLWLHPDHETNSPRSLYASRVTQAWNDLKTAERRLAYDSTRDNAAHDASQRDLRGASTSTVARRPARRHKSLWRYMKHLMRQGH